MTFQSQAYSSIVADVRACTTCASMAHAHVLGSANGPLDARIVFVAEAVGRRGGAISGVPLTRDDTGKRFAAFLAIAGIDRADCFITNAVLCNPIDACGRNRAPLTTEVARCRPFLARTLDVVAATTVVPLDASLWNRCAPSRRIARSCRTTWQHPCHGLAARSFPCTTRRVSRRSIARRRCRRRIGGVLARVV